MIPFIQHSQKDEIIEMDNRLRVASTDQWGGGGEGRCCGYKGILGMELSCTFNVVVVTQIYPADKIT